MNTTRALLGTILAAALVAGCEPSLVATLAPGTPPPSAAPSAVAGGSAAPSAGGSGGVTGGTHAVGQATATDSATGAVISGHGPVLKTPTFNLPGPITMKLSTCGANGTFPFIWLYTEFNATVGQYVEEVTSIPQVKAGKYYMHVVSPPDCEWTVTFTGS